MKTWITSDHHFNHENIKKTNQSAFVFRMLRNADISDIIKYCKRPFGSVEEMNEVMIKKWNEKVGKEDIVIHLGDFGFGDVKKIAEIRKRLNGNIVLLAGNHESYKKMENCDFIVIKEGIIQIRNFILSHIPLSLEKMPKGFVNIHGHIHEKESKHGINVSVEKTNYGPVELDELVK